MLLSCNDCRSPTSVAIKSRLPPNEQSGYSTDELRSVVQVLLGSPGFYRVLRGSFGFYKVLGFGPRRIWSDLNEPSRTQWNPAEPGRTQERIRALEPPSGWRGRSGVGRRRPPGSLRLRRP